MKCCPPKPGWTDITSSRSMWASQGSQASNGVSGLTARPAPRPSRRMASISVRGAVHLDVHAAVVGAGLGERLQIVAGVGHHQVAVEVGVGVAADGGHHRRPDRQVGHEVPVHDIHVQPVGLGPDPVDLGSEGGEVGRQDRRGDANHPAHPTGLPADWPAHCAGSEGRRTSRRCRPPGEAAGPPGRPAATAAPGGGSGLKLRSGPGQPAVDAAGLLAGEGAHAVDEDAARAGPAARRP